MIERLRVYALLMRLHRPIGILLLLWPTLWALWIAAEGRPDPLLVCVFVCGVVLMRSAGCVINDYADRHIDGHVRRTRQRPLATGEATPREALILFMVLSLTAFALVLQLNRLTIIMSLGGVLLAASYPFAKRYTYLPQVHLGLAFGWAIPMAFAAQTNTVPDIAWLLLIAKLLWTVVYDTFYAMVDREDDLKIGVKSTAILFDDLDRMITAGLQIVLFVVCLVIADKAELGLYFHLGLLIAALLAVYQQYLIRAREPDDCFKAFLNNNWFGAVIFTGLLLDYQLA